MRFMAGNRLKILMTTDTLGGVWSYVCQLCKALALYDVEIHLAALGRWPTRDQERTISKIPNTILYKSDFKLEWMQDPWRDVEKSEKWLTAIYQTVQPHIIHLNNFTKFKARITCPVITVYHSCVESWFRAVKGENPPQEFKIYLKHKKIALKQANIAIFPSNSFRKEIVEQIELNVETQTIYNGCDLHFSSRLEKEDMILCSGRIWDEGKNLHLLCHIAPLLPWPVYVAGENVHPNTGKPVEIKNVFFLGNLSKTSLETWMKKASIYVSTSLYEPFGLGVLEAAKLECALVLSHIDTMEEIWQDNAVFFDPLDAEDLLQMVMLLINNSNFRHDLAEKAYKKAGFYSAKIMAENYYNLYREMLNPVLLTKQPSTVSI
tara:strand:- start:70081 stop:71211 length:1131 start_codon:yes stop_codon:yes gene_type:complete